jgi:hypothetical protein
MSGCTNGDEKVLLLVMEDVSVTREKKLCSFGETSGEVVVALGERRGDSKADSRDPGCVGCSLRWIWSGVKGNAMILRDRAVMVTAEACGWCAASQSSVGSIPTTVRDGTVERLCFSIWRVRAPEIQVSRKQRTTTVQLGVRGVGDYRTCFTLANDTR